MKITILGNTNNPMSNKPTNTPYSWFVLTYCQGFELNGHKVQLIDYNSNNINAIRRKIIEHRPSYCFTHLTFHNNAHRTENMLQLFSDLYKKHDIRFIHTCSDARSKDRYMNDISHSFYAAFVGTHDMVNNCTPKWNIPVYYSPYSSLTYRNIAEPVDELKMKKAVFTGGEHTHKDRSNFIKLLKEYGLPMKIYQTQSSNDMRHRTPELSSSAPCILGLCTGYDLKGFADPRPFQYMGTGACFLARRFKEMDDIIPPDLYYPFDGYSRPDAKYVKDVWRRILKTDTWPMRCKAFRFMQQNHSSRIRIKQILNTLDGGCHQKMIDNHIEVNTKITQKNLINLDEEPIYKAQTKAFNFFGKYINTTDRVLDIGTRSGTLLEIYRDNGIVDSQGIDVVSEAVEYCNNKGVKVSIADMHKIEDYPDGKFDVISIVHTLEHSIDIKKVLTNIYEKLNNRGIVFISVPIQKYEAPDLWGHFSVITDENNLLKMLDDTGFTVIQQHKQNKKKSTNKPEFKVVCQKM